MNDRSPRLFPHMVVPDLQPRTPELSPIATGGHSSDSQLLRSWVERDPEFDDDMLAHPLSRWTILGIVIVIATSGAFWTGVGLLINYWIR